MLNFSCKRKFPWENLLRCENEFDEHANDSDYIDFSACLIGPKFSLVWNLLHVIATVILKEFLTEVSTQRTGLKLAMYFYPLQILTQPTFTQTVVNSDRINKSVKLAISWAMNNTINF